MTLKKELRRSIICLAFVIQFVIFYQMQFVYAQGEEMMLSGKQKIIFVENADLRKAIDLASPHSIIVCDREKRLTLESTLVISKPLTLKGLNAVLADGVGNTAILEIIADGVRLDDFKLKGNVNTIARHEKESLVKVYGSDFIIENGEVREASRHAIRVYGGGKEGKLTDGILRNINGYNITRDVISLEGEGNEWPIDNVTVENIKAYNSPERGVVEVSDGATNVTISNIYGDSCRYGVCIQEHKPGQSERNIRIEGVRLRNCQKAVCTWGNYDNENMNITIRDVIAENVPSSPDHMPLELEHIDNLTVDNITLVGCGKAPKISIQNCNRVNLRDIIIDQKDQKILAAVLIEDCNDVLVDGVICRSEPNKVEHALLYRIQSNNRFQNLKVKHIVAENVINGGIALKNNSKQGSLDYYIIKDNITSVVDSVFGAHRIIKDNLIP
jgi:hypothetical protein